jgi:hypothetical protein
MFEDRFVPSQLFRANPKLTTMLTIFLPSQFSIIFHRFPIFPHHFPPILVSLDVVFDFMSAVDASGCEAQVLPKPANRNLLTRWLPRACKTHERFN